MLSEESGLSWVVNPAAFELQEAKRGSLVSYQGNSTAKTTEFDKSQGSGTPQRRGRHQECREISGSRQDMTNAVQLVERVMSPSWGYSMYVSRGSKQRRGDQQYWNQNQLSVKIPLFNVDFSSQV